MAEFEIKGGAELQRALNELPVKLERNVMRGALRAAAVQIEQEAKARAPADSGKLRDSIRVSTGAKRGGTVYAHVKVGGVKKGDAFYARFVEFGTRPHEIRPRRSASLFIGGLLRTLVRHPGTQARPFLRPAFDSKAGEAIRAFGDYMAARLERIAKRSR